MIRRILLLPCLLAAPLGLAQSPEWAGYPVDENGWADAADWLGWINVSHAPWIHIVALEGWAYIEEPDLQAPGAWGWLTRASMPAVDESLLLHLSFDSRQAVDDTGKQSNIIVSGPIPGEGDYTGAFFFNGTTDYISIPDFDYGPFFTVSFWFNSPSNAGSLYRYMFSHNEVHATHSVNIYFVEDGNTSEGGEGRIKTTIVDVNDDGDTRYFTQPGLSDGQWHLYTVSVHEQGMSVYVDAQLVQTWAQGGDVINPPGPIILGRRSDMDLNRSYNGYLDDIRVYNRALDADEVADLYLKGR